jgi:DNA-binding NarL/FixJ family response regulator
MKRVRIVIADDHEMVASGLRYWLSSEADFEVIAAAESGKQSLSLVQTLQPEVLIQDLKMPDMSGIEVIRHLRYKRYPIKIMALTGSGVFHVGEVLQSGADGYCSKEEKREVLIEGIRTILSPNRQEQWISPLALKTLLEDERTAQNVGLTTMELRVLSLLKLPNKSIAERLFLAEGTVRNHISSIYAKLGVQARYQAIAWAEKRGLLLA